MRIWISLFLAFCMALPLPANTTPTLSPDPSCEEAQALSGEAAAFVQIKDEIWPLDAYGHLLPQEEGREGLPMLSGLTVLPSTPGEMLEVPAKERPLFLQTTQLLTALAARDMLGHVTDFICVDSDMIRFGYGDGLTVVVSVTDDIDLSTRVLQLQRASEAFQERGESLTGTFDFTYGAYQARLLVERWLPEELVREDDQP